MSVIERRTDPRAIAEQVGLPSNIGNYASMILEQLDRQDYQIPSDDRTYPAAVYVAARDEGEPITAEEIADAAGVRETAVAREYHRIVDTLGISPELASPEAFIDRFGEGLDLDEETVEEAKALYALGGEEGLFGSRSGSVTAALCLYAAGQITDDEITQPDFTDYGVAEITVRKGYRPVLSLRGEGVPTGDKMDDYEDTGQLVEEVESIHEQIENVPDAVLDAAREIVEEIRGEAWVLGKSAAPIAAAVYWLAAQQNRLDVSQAEVAAAAGSHKVTVNRRVSTLRKSLSGELDEEEEEATDPPDA